MVIFGLDLPVIADLLHRLLVAAREDVVVVYLLLSVVLHHLLDLLHKTNR